MSDSIPTDKEATKRNIYAAFRSMAQKVTPTDNLLIYFSGHGEFDKAWFIFLRIMVFTKGITRKFRQILLTQPGIKIGERIGEPRFIGMEEEAGFE